VGEAVDGAPAMDVSGGARRKVDGRVARLRTAVLAAQRAERAGQRGREKRLLTAASRHLTRLTRVIGTLERRGRIRSSTAAVLRARIDPLAAAMKSFAEGDVR
jgi:hypothetical protein